MHARAVQHARIAPSPSGPSAVAALFVQDSGQGGPGVVIPRPEVHLVVRFGSAARGGVDVHAFGGRKRVHRKLIQDGQRAVTARLPLGASTAVLGVPSSSLAARVVALEDLWGDLPTRRLCARLAETRDTASAAAILASAISERTAGSESRQAGAELALAAADRLLTASVQSVAAALGVSERHLRRVFRETVGMGPKAFVKLSRFRRALFAAHRSEARNWASIAADAGYYDQAHLIAEFRAISDVTPRELVGELRAARLLM